jgi:hypothetical protein
MSARSSALSPPASFLSWAAFEDGDADLSLDPALYAVTGGHEWALLPPAPAASLLQAAARTAAAAGIRNTSRPPLMPQLMMTGHAGCGLSGSAAAPVNVSDGSDDDELAWAKLSRKFFEIWVAFQRSKFASKFGWVFIESRLS